jgi:hypothetical protein
VRRPCPERRALRKQVIQMRKVTGDPNVRNVVDPGLLGFVLRGYSATQVTA